MNEYKTSSHLFFILFNQNMHFSIFLKFNWPLDDCITNVQVLNNYQFWSDFTYMVFIEEEIYSVPLLEKLLIFSLKIP